MRVCVVGSGGREHALAHVLARTAEVVVTPGNPGIPGSVDDAARGARRRPVRDRARGAAGRRAWPTGCGPPGKLVFGPGADGARLEGSKAWMKEVLVEARACPPPATASFTDAEPAARLPARRCPARTSSRPTGWPPARACWSPSRSTEAADDVRAKLSGDGVRRRRPHGRDRGGPDRPRAVAARRLRRQRAVPLAPGPGLQARRRRRHRPEHRRHGRLLAGARSPATTSSTT